MSKYKANNKYNGTVGVSIQYWADEEAMGQIEDVISAYKDNFDLISFAVDIFNLGAINGIRKERSRK